MKRILLAFTLITALSGIAYSGDVDDVNAATEALRIAMLNGDKAELEKHILPDLIYVHSAGKVENAQQFVEAIAPGPNKLDTYIKINFGNQQIATDGNLAIVTHIFDAEASTIGRNDGKPYTAHIGVTQVWKKHDGAWKLQARKASMIPF